MKRTRHLLLFIVLVLFFVPMFSGAATRDSSLSTAAQVRYRAEVAYGGEFEEQRLYRLQNEHANWFGSKRPALIEQIRCRDARKALARRGRWQGRLRWDGTCGDQGDPIEYVTGNFLNFQDLRK